MKRFIPYIALVALIGVTACGGNSPSARPVPTVVPDAWTISSLEASSYSPYVGTIILIEVEVRRNGSAAPDGTSVEMSSTGPGTLFGFTNGTLTKGAPIVSEDGTIVTEDGVARTGFVAWDDETSDADTPAGSYTIQARVNDAVAQIVVSYRERSSTESFQLYDVDPRRGSFEGGDGVLITGKGIVAPVEVFFDLAGVTYQAIVVTVDESDPLSDPGSINILTPAFTGADTSREQAADVRVIVGAGTGSEQTDTLTQAFVLLPSLGPVIYGVSPNSGRSSGGEIVSILGKGFGSVAGELGVGFVDPNDVSKLGNVLAVSPDGAQIQVETPRFSTVPLENDILMDVVVSTPRSPARLDDGFVVLADEPQPQISTLSPVAGPLDGGTLVTIFGSGFQIPMQVRFGVLTATDVNVFNDTSPADNDRITCVTPDYSQQGDVPPVTVDVTVTNMVSGKTATLGGAYRYGDPLYITANSPAEGGPGDLVVIYGSGFEDPLQVFFPAGSATQMDVVSVSGTELLIQVPPDLPPTCSNAAGPFGVKLIERNIDEVSGGSFLLRGNSPVVLSVEPVILSEILIPASVNPDEITIYGQYFNDQVVVQVGNYQVPQVDFTVVSDELIEVENLPDVTTLGISFSTVPCILPGGEPGQRSASTPVSVSVTNYPGSCTNTLNGAFVIEPATTTCTATPANIEVTTGLTSGTWLFPDTDIGSTSAQLQIELTNTGGQTTTSLNLTFPATDFVYVSDNCPAALAYNQTCQVIAEFTPTVAGLIQNSLVIDWTDATFGAGSTIVPLEGTGTVP